MRARSWVTAIAVTGVLAGCAEDPATTAPALHPDLEEWPTTTVEVEASGETHEVAAVVAATPERRQRGLQEVEDVPDGSGMLFLFDRDRTSGFWMKDTLVPLEIAFVSHDGVIVEVLSMEPCEADPCTVYRPGAPYRAALEVPDGWLTERDLGPGDQLSWGETTRAR